MKYKKYRIVKTKAGKYECEMWRLWFPFWRNMGSPGGNTHTTKKSAKNYLEKHSGTKEIVLRA